MKIALVGAVIIFIVAMVWGSNPLLSDSGNTRSVTDRLANAAENDLGDPSAPWVLKSTDRLDAHGLERDWYCFALSPMLSRDDQSVRAVTITCGSKDERRGPPNVYARTIPASSRQQLRFGLEDVLFVVTLDATEDWGSVSSPVQVAIDVIR